MLKKRHVKLSTCLSILMVGTVFSPSINKANAQTSFLSSFFKQYVPSGVCTDRMPSSFADLAEKLLPTVVNISTSKVIKPGQHNDDEDEDDEEEDNSANSDPNSPFEKFFHDYMNRKGGADGSTYLHALGSGFIIDPSGLIVTNYHVIKGADQVNVTLQNNQFLKATLVGFDERTDLALLKVKTKTPLPAAHFGDSDRSRVGDWVLAIGNPFGLSGTVTSGIISSRGRDIEQGPYDDFIQTDAPINKGNSGGPLFNTQCDVIGINTAIFSPSGGSIGIAFAIPSNEAKNILDQLRQSGKVSRGWVGVRIQEITENIAESLNITPFQGALVVKVDRGSPAQSAGLKAGDVIQTLNEKMITSHTMPRLIAQMKKGDKILVGVLRQGKEITIPLTVGSLSDGDGNDALQKKESEQVSVVQLKELALSVSNMTDILRQKYNLLEKQQGIVITAVDQNAGTNHKRLKPGDLIIGTDKKNITTIAALQEQIAIIKKENKKNPQKKLTILLLVQSDSNMHWVAIPFAKAK